MYLLENMMATDDTFLEDDGVFGYSCQYSLLPAFSTKTAVTACGTHLALSRVGRGFNNCTPYLYTSSIRHNGCSS